MTAETSGCGADDALEAFKQLHRYVDEMYGNPGARSSEGRGAYSRRADEGSSAMTAYLQGSEVMGTSGSDAQTMETMATGMLPPEPADAKVIGPRPSPELTITFPENGQTIIGGPDIVDALFVSGTVGPGTTVKSVEIECPGFDPASQTVQVYGNQWSAGLVPAPMPSGSRRYYIAATASSPFGTVGDRVQFTLKLDMTGPSLAVSATIGKLDPITGQYPVVLSGSATDASVITGVEWSLDGAAYRPVTKTTPGSGWDAWTANFTVTYGTHRVTVQARDQYGNVTSRNLTIKTVDSTPPALSIDQLRFLYWVGEIGRLVAVDVVASDAESGVANLWWRVGEQGVPVLPPPDPDNGWLEVKPVPTPSSPKRTVTILVPALHTQVISFYCRDRAGNYATAEQILSV